jgi:acyl-CoA reductase-like NAD-dependent aldehyde dehydrogenase
VGTSACDESFRSLYRLSRGGRRGVRLWRSRLLTKYTHQLASADNSPTRIREAFGPVAILWKFSDCEAALDEVNDSRFGLQAGIFTRDPGSPGRRGVVIGDVPSCRVDNMPYGGVKDSGLGREGVRFAMEDMTEIRNLVIRRRYPSVSTGYPE